MRFRVRGLALALVLAACGGGKASGGGAGGDGGAAGDGGIGGTGGVETIADRTAAVCANWTSTVGHLDPGTWTAGSVIICKGGDNPVGRASAIKLVNAYRFLASLDPVVDDPSAHESAQACALIMDANNSLSHFPPTTWTCYSKPGADGAGNSNIATAEGVYAVHLYMADGGANNTDILGHRRWILSPAMTTVGPGTTDTFSCLRVLHSYGAGKQLPFVAWPPPGPVPEEVVTGDTIGAGALDDIGWSIQTNAIDPTSAQVEVTHEGLQLPVTTSPLAGGYGSDYAIKFVPQGWRSEVGQTYSVHVTGVAQPIDYSVKLVSCK